MKYLSALLLVLYSLATQAGPLSQPWYQSNLEDYEAGVMIEPIEKDEGSVNTFGYLRSITERPNTGKVMQNVSLPSDLLGRRVKLTGHLKTELRSASVVMFMSVYHVDGQVTFDRMSDRKITETLPQWQPVEIILDIPDEPSTTLIFGIAIKGHGIVYFDDFSFEEVSYDTEVTGTTRESKPKSQPKNLGFEQ